ncbi:MAG TPA: hemolysin family protein [Jiangellales bacterium]|nr:hemolysin family protein [Jiangellales bacterium]
MSDAVAIGLAVLLLAGNAFFVGAEFALVSARRSAIEPLAEAGNGRARTTLRAMEQVSLMMAGSQLGITVCSLGLGAVAEPAVAHQLERLFELLGMPSWLLHPTAFAIALAVVVALHMVLGEMVPKNLAIAGPERAALLFGPPLAAVVRVLRPVIAALNAAANLLVRVAGAQPQDEVASTFTAEEVAGLIEESEREGLLDTRDARLMQRAVRFTDQDVADVLLPRQELRTLPDGHSVDDLERLVVATGYSRFPVEDAAGTLLGYVHAKDVLHLDDASPDTPYPERHRRDLPTVAPDASLDEVVQQLQDVGAHLAAVVDAEGEARGVVMLEDALEALVGAVRDRTHSHRR